MGNTTIKSFFIILIIMLVISGCSAKESSTPENLTPQPNYTLTPSITHTIAPTKTATIQPTATITTIPTLTPTENPKDVLDGWPSIAYQESWYADIHLFNIQTNTDRVLYNPEDSVGLWGWWGDGCHLVVGNAYVSSGSVYLLDLLGNLEELTTFDFDYDEYGVVMNVEISPDQQWVIYLVAQWVNSQIDPDFYKIYTSPIDDPETIYEISSSGGAFFAGWSHDSSYFVYPDFDANGVHQLYISNPDGSKQTQLTRFTTQKVMKSRPVFSISPDDRYILLFRDFNQNPDTGEMAIIDFSRGITNPIMLNQLLNIDATGISSQWWVDENLIIVLAMYVEGSTIERTYLWLEIPSLNIVDELPYPEEIETLSTSRWLGEKILFLTYQAIFILYDIESQTIEVETPLPVPYFERMAMPPQEYEDLTFCLP